MYIARPACHGSCPLPVGPVSGKQSTCAYANRTLLLPTLPGLGDHEQWLDVCLLCCSRRFLRCDTVRHSKAFIGSNYFRAAERLTCPMLAVIAVPYIDKS